MTKSGVIIPVSIENIDTTTGSVGTISQAHREIHTGEHYYIEGFATLASGVSLYVKLVTPDTKKWAHFLWEIECSGGLITYLDEDATGGMANGNSVTPLSNNRNEQVPSGMIITSGVTVATGYGTRISQASWKNKAGGTQAREDEIILKQGTTYLRTFTSSEVGNVVRFKASWYEHTNKGE